MGSTPSHYSQTQGWPTRPADGQAFMKATSEQGAASCAGIGSDVGCVRVCIGNTSIGNGVVAKVLVCLCAGATLHSAVFAGVGAGANGVVCARLGADIGTGANNGAGVGVNMLVWRYVGDGIRSAIDAKAGASVGAAVCGGVGAGDGALGIMKSMKMT